MKYLILTSSIFYLLGVKMTQDIQATKTAKNDTVTIQTKGQNPSASLLEKNIFIPAGKLTTSCEKNTLETIKKSKQPANLIKNL